MERLQLSVLTNKQLIESAFKQIEEETGFHIIKKEFGNCYFLFEDEEDSICHFYIKEIPGFKFAFWNICRFDSINYQIENFGLGNTWADSLQISPKSELVFFTQYEKELDKFKPSNSAFVQGIYRQVYNEEDQLKEEWYLSDIPKILEYISKHRLKSIIYSYYKTRYIWEELSLFRILKIYINNSFYNFKYKFRKWFSLQKAKFISKKLVRKLKYTNAYIIDKGDCWSPRISIFYRKVFNASKENYNKDYDLIDKFFAKYSNIISLNPFFIYFDYVITSEDLKKDEQLQQQFWDNVTQLKQNSYFDKDEILEGAKLIYMNINNQEYKLFK